MGNRLTMGNFFSGSGTWELAAKICGIDVLFESEIEPFPVALEAKRFPEAIQLGDVSKVNGAEIPPVDIMTNSSPCFVGSSLVNTSDGLKEIKDVRIGDKVLTHNNEYKTVTDSGCTGVKKVFELRAMGIDSIICTENHPFLVRKLTRKYPTYYVDGKRKRGNTRVFGEPEWKPLKDLDKTYYIGTAINQNSENSKNLTVEEMWLLGRYIADGYRKHDQPTVSFCIGYAKVDEFMKHLDAYRGYVDRQRTAMKYCITDKRLWELCGMCGDGAINKEFPAWILDLPADDLKVVVDGYLSGDGCYNEKCRLFQSATISRKLAYSFGHAVAKAFCCTYKIYKEKKNPTCVIEGRTVKQHDTYEVRFQEGRKQDKAFYEDGHVWFPIRDIAEHGESEVYNLSVEDDESYTVQNIMVHNCQDLSVAGKRAGLDGERSGLFMEVIRITKEMRNADRLRSGRTTEYLRPRFWCWENVPGALSSAGGQTSKQSSKKSSALSNQSAMYLCLRNGANRALWTEITGNWHGESWMPNFTESPRDAEDCTLSSILLDTVPEKYFLSEKACLGILRRSLKRGKELPLVLRNALILQAGLSMENYELIAGLWKLQNQGLTAEMIQKYSA